jgi:hypothetical protein
VFDRSLDEANSSPVGMSALSAGLQPLLTQALIRELAGYAIEGIAPQPPGIVVRLAVFGR